VRRLVVVVAAFALYATTVQAAPVVREGAGPTNAESAAARDAFRADIGGGTTAGPHGSFGGVRREIDWDDVPSGFASPNQFPAAVYFMTTSPRGLRMFTPDGTGFQVSADSPPTQARFGNINPTYPATFSSFSSPRMFTPTGGRQTFIGFSVPGADTSASTRAFGAVFADVDTAGAARVEFFGGGGSLLVRDVPASAGAGSLSFLGVSFPDGPPVEYVQITTGTAALGPGTTDSGADLVVMDDFIYAEPVALQPRDSDGDGVADASDNCPTISNPDQRDTDGDGYGNVCDVYGPDTFPGPDADADGIPDDVDPDDDNDGLADVDEVRANTSPRNPDSDGDGALDGPDNCKTDANADQMDGDANGKGDECDEPALRALAVKRARRGFTVSYRLSERASVRFSVETKQGRGWKRVRGAFTRAGVPGKNSFAFDGKINRKAIKAGAHRLVAVATDRQHVATDPARASFSVRRAKKR
jgi:hypothetical protein